MMERGGLRTAHENVTISKGLTAYLENREVVIMGSARFALVF